jgi:hypothetical protein
MAFAPATSNYFANADTTAGVSIPFADLVSIADQTEADDIREVVYSILNQVADVYIPLDSADKTTSMTVNRSTSMVDADTIRKTFTVSLLLDVNNLTVVD